MVVISRSAGSSCPALLWISQGQIWGCWYVVLQAWGFKGGKYGGLAIACLIIWKRKVFRQCVHQSSSCLVLIAASVAREFGKFFLAQMYWDDCSSWSILMLPLSSLGVWLSPYLVDLGFYSSHPYMWYVVSPFFSLVLVWFSSSSHLFFVFLFLGKVWVVVLSSLPLCTFLFIINKSVLLLKKQSTIKFKVKCEERKKNWWI